MVLAHVKTEADHSVVGCHLVCFDSSLNISDDPCIFRIYEVGDLNILPEFLQGLVIKLSHVLQRGPFDVFFGHISIILDLFFFFRR